MVGVRTCYRTSMADDISLKGKTKMIKVTTSKFIEDDDGTAYEVRNIRRTDSDGRTTESTQIIKRPHFNRDIKVEESTLQIINQIGKGAGK